MVLAALHSDSPLPTHLIFPRQVVSCVVNGTAEPMQGADDVITVTWRLSGKVNVGPGISIKPYLVFSDLHFRRSDGLIIFQVGRPQPLFVSLLAAISIIG